MRVDLLVGCRVTPVRDRNTSSRSGVVHRGASTSTGRRRAGRAASRSASTPPSLGILSASACSSRPAAEKRRDAGRARRVSELQPDRCRPGRAASARSGVPSATTRPSSSTAIAIGQSVRLLQVLRREEDRDAVGDQLADDVPHVRRLRGSRPVVGSSRKMIRGSPIRVIARSSPRPASILAAAVPCGTSSAGSSTRA